MNRREFIGAAGVALVASMLPAAAAMRDVAIEPLYVNKKGGEINVRIVVANPGNGVHEGYDVRLLVRGNAGEDWRELKRWHEHYLPAGKLARDYIPVPPIDAAFSSGAYQLRAEVEQHGTVIKSLEQTFQ